MSYEDILYDRDDTGVVTITINRPDNLNAFRTQTVDELVDAFRTAWADRGCGVVLTGAGDRAEIWYLCRQYSATEALQMGLVNTVVPKARLMEEARAWAAEILQKSPTALKLAKASFNADTESIRGIAALGMTGLALYYDTEESAEGTVAFQEKRAPDFGRFRK